MDFSKTAAAVAALDGEEKVWLDTYTVASADAAAAQARAAMEQELTKNGILMAPRESLTAWEIQWRKDRDTQAFIDGNQIELDAEILAQEVAATVAEHEPLYPLARRYEGSADRGLLAIVADELCENSARARFAGLTRGELTAAYGRLSDTVDRDNAAIRIIEDAVIGRTLDRLALRDDRDHDALDLPALQKAVAARRSARVPAEVRDAAARLAKGRSLQFKELLGHLKRGRGIASRPEPRVLQVV